jgi:hypothetical protein
MSGVSTATVIGVAGLAMSAVGTISSAFAQQRQGEVAAQIGGYNASIFNQQANQAQAEAAARADILRRDNERKMASTRAAYAAAGVDPNQGTPLDVMEDQATEAELQRRLVLYQGDTAAMSLRQRAALASMGGAAAAEAGTMAAGTTLLTGATRVGFGAYNLFGGSTKKTVPETGPGTGYTY